MDSSEAEPKKTQNRMAFMLLVAGIVFGFAVGYGVGYLVCQPEISRLQISLSDIESDLSVAQAEISSLESELSKSQEEPIAETSLLINKSLSFETIVGDNLVLGKITEKRADLGTLPQGSTAQFQLSISNNADRPQKILLSVDGNASKLITFDVIEIVQPGSTASVTILVNASVEKGFYYGIIVIEGVYE
jgi:hypothetical protein